MILHIAYADDIVLKANMAGSRCDINKILSHTVDSLKSELIFEMLYFVNSLIKINIGNILLY